MNAINAFKALFVDYKVITIPLFSIIVAMVIKAVSLPGKLEGGKVKELFNFGDSLRNSGLMYMSTSIYHHARQALIYTQPITRMEDAVLAQTFMILAYILCMLIFSLTLRNYAYDKTEKMSIGWVIISDITGIGMFLSAIWFVV